MRRVGVPLWPGAEAGEEGTRESAVRTPPPRASSRRAGLFSPDRDGHPRVENLLLVSPYARVVTATEHARIARRATQRLVAAGIQVTPDAANPARFLPMPGSTPGAPFEVTELDGPRLLPDEWLRSPS